MYFYTNCVVNFNKVLVRGYRNGKRFQEKIGYKPYLFMPSKTTEEEHTLAGLPVEKLNFSSISEARSFVRDYRDVAGMQFYGMTNWEYLYLYDEFPKKIEYNKSDISIGIIDIEVYVGDGFPNIREAEEPITAITLSSHKTKKIYCFGLKAHRPENENVIYVLCKDEADLLKKFIEIWKIEDFDIISGWNCERFDIPYLVNRISNILGEYAVKELSPWNIVEGKEIPTKWGSPDQIYNIVGITILDYIDLYKKFRYVNRESYKLDFISFVELGENKVDYSHIGTLNDLYDKDPDLFYTYNIHDTVLVDRLDDKLGYLDIVISMAYLYGCNYIDTLTTVKPWDICIHKYLRNNNIVIPQSSFNYETRSLIGGYVKDPILDLYRWVVSFDIKSSYPHQIMTYQISPENLVEKRYFDIDEFFEITDGRGRNTQTYQTLEYAKSKNLICAGNGCLFSKDEGFMPRIMNDFFNQRKEAEGLKSKAEALFQETKKEEYKNEASRYNAQQLALKISINAFYGSLANAYCRWFSIDLAEAITMSGQLAIRWAEKKVNDWFNKILKTEGVDYVIAIDTDSLMVNVTPIISRMELKDKPQIIKVLQKLSKEKVEEVIKEAFIELSDWLGSQNKISMAREVISSGAIWTAKKRYVMNVDDLKGKQYDPPDLKITGIEAVRSSTPMVCRTKIKEGLRLLLNNSEEDLQKFILEFKEEFNKMPFIEVASPSSVNGIKKYGDSISIYGKGSPLHVRGSLLYNDRIKKLHLENRYPLIKEGSKIKYCYLKMPNLIGEDVFATPDIDIPKELNLDQFIDYNKQFEKTFVAPLTHLTNVIGWSTEKKITLEGFFG